MFKLEPLVRKSLLIVAAVFILTIFIVAVFGGQWQKTLPETAVSSSAEEERATLQEDESAAAVDTADSTEVAPTTAPSPTPTPLPEPTLIPVAFEGVALTETALFSLPEADAGSGQTIPAGQALLLRKTNDPLWAESLSEDGQLLGYVYTKQAAAAGTAESLFDQAFREKVAELQGKLPQGMYWNHPDDPSISWGEETPWHVTDIPCSHWANGEIYCNFYNGSTEEVFGGSMNECLGFASLLSDQVFGVDAPVHVFEDTSLLRAGDHIRLREYEHSMTVLSLDDEGFLIGECNADYEDCLINWTRFMTWGEYENYRWDAYYISRYPFARDEDGDLVPWYD